jgi:DNA-binding CsgD family transcriptional regulator
VPFQGHNGRCDFVGVSSRHAERLDPARTPLLRAVCAQVFYRLADLTDSSLTGDQETAELTRRELEILKWVKHGKSNTEISDIMSVSVKTIEYHVGNILKKLGAANRTAAVVIAIRNKLLAL